MAQIHTFEFMQAEVNDLKAEIERLTKWNHERLEELKERDLEIERLKHQLAIAEGNGARAQSYFETCERLRATLEDILSLQPLKTQHEHYIAMLKTLDIVRKTLNEQLTPEQISRTIPQIGEKR